MSSLARAFNVRRQFIGIHNMRQVVMFLRFVVSALGFCALLFLGGSVNVQAQTAQRPNKMTDDIGWMQAGAYHRGIGPGETPYIDLLAK